MKNIFLIILTLITVKLAGQNHIIGVKGGISQTNVTSSNFAQQHDFRTGIAAGLTYEYQFKKPFSVGADLIYNQRGFTNDIVFTDQNGNPTGEKFAIRNNYDYVSLPIKAGFNIGNKFFGFANLGVIPSILVNANTLVPIFNTEGKVTGTESFDNSGSVTKFDFAGLAEIGGGYKFKNRYWLFTSFVYQHSFTTMTNSEYYSGSQIRHNGMTLNIGLKWELNKE